MSVYDEIMEEVSIRVDLATSDILSKALTEFHNLLEYKSYLEDWKPKNRLSTSSIPLWQIQALERARISMKIRQFTW